MSGAYYEIYLKGILDLVGTMVIKSEDNARAINERLTSLRYEVLEAVPKTWKYYLNLAGRYHVSDTPMTIVSMDTQEEIDFTVENLRIHARTKREYTYRSRYRRELVAKFPEQEELIEGILNPINIDVAIAARDHTILYYDKVLVEPTEYNLIPNLQAFVDGFFARWDVPDYRITDSLYTAAQLGLLFSLLPKAIMNLRLLNCKSEYAHSFHIDQYLIGFGNMGKYLEFMTHNQKLFFYRNIRYINKNNGKIETFEWLTEKVLTDRNFPLAEYDIRQNTENMPEDLYPSVELVRRSINGLTAASGSDVKSVMEVLDMEQALAKDNITVQSDALEEIPLMMRNSRDSILKTKVLESNVIDKTDAEPYTLTDILINHWLFFAEKGWYVAVLPIENPSTGEVMNLSSKDAFILWLYAYNRARGIEMNVVPRLEACRVKRWPEPTRQELLDMTNRKYVPEYFIDAAKDNQPIVGQYISVDAFRAGCQAIHKAMLLHFDLSAYQPHDITRVQVEMMTDRFYMNYPVDLGYDTPYLTWLSDRNIDVENLGSSELDLLANQIFSTATGKDSGVSQTLKEIQRAMLGIMSDYNSYSIQFVQQINSAAITVARRKRIKPGDTKSSTSGSGLFKRRVRIKNYRSRVLNSVRQMKVGVLMIRFVSKLAAHKVFLQIGLQKRIVGKSNGSGRGRNLRIHTQMQATPLTSLQDALDNVSILGYLPLEQLPTTDLFDSTVSEDYRPLSETEKRRLVRY